MTQNFSPQDQEILVGDWWIGGSYKSSMGRSHYSSLVFEILVTYVRVCRSSVSEGGLG